jgi:hypothetical protein
MMTSKRILLPNPGSRKARNELLPLNQDDPISRPRRNGNTQMIMMTNQRMT